MSVERKFTVNLQALVKNYGASVRSLVERHGNRSLESPGQKIPIGADTLIKSIQQLADMTIVQKAEPVALNAALTSFQHGKAWAERALSTRGVTNPVTGLTKPFFLPPERRAIDKIAARNLMEIKGMSDELAKRTSRSLVEGFEKSETINQLTRRVKDVTDFGTNRAEMIARTETMRAVNSAARDRYQQAGVEKVEWLTAWDDRVCPECEDLHGEIFDLGDAPDLPVHPNCRCTLAPVIGGVASD